MDNIKVLTIGNHPSVKGGITSVINQIMEYDWKAEGINMSFIATYKEGLNISKILYFIKSYNKILMKFIFDRPNIVHIHMSYKGSFTRKYAIHKLCRLLKIKDIVHLHGSEFEKWYNESGKHQKKKIRRLLRESCAFIVLGDKWNKIIKNIEPETRTLVVSNTVHIPDEKVSWNGDVLQVLFMGILIERKGVADLLKAVNKIALDKKVNNMRLVIAGTGKEEEKLKQMSKDLDIDQYITFAGWTSGEKKCELLRNCQLLVLPSYNEGLPIAILEALSYGMPVVATDVGDISSAVKDNKNGYLIQPGDYSQLAIALEKIASSRELYIKMSDASRDIAEKAFNEKVYFKQLKVCYENCSRLCYNFGLGGRDAFF